MKVCSLATAVLLTCAVSSLQAQNAQVSGLILDQSKAVVPAAKVAATNLATGVERDTTSNRDGVYTLVSLAPGQYRISVRASGFRGADRDLVLEVEQNARVDFVLPVGSDQQSVTVTGEAPLLTTENAAVSTVVDRTLVGNLPLNGRSIQALVELAPGIVPAAAGPNNMGQYSVNGARADANYYTVDGVSANFGSSVSINPASSYNGSTPAFGATGGSNNLVSLDALQEFRIQTSSYAPEFGRSPGAQISLVTRSGTNQLHGTAFEYLRNDVFDASNWFANAGSLAKAAERQNDFGGTFSGPIRKDKTFFFFSYEGLRLRQPTVSQTLVPTVAVRQSAAAALQPFLNAFPLPTGPEILDSKGNKTGLAHSDASVSNPTTLDATSLKVDHNFGPILLFGRYSYAPSSTFARNPTNVSNSTANGEKTATQTATTGLTWVVSPRMVDDLRMNYSRASASGQSIADNFGGALPLPLSTLVPSGYSYNNAFYTMTISNTLGYRTRFDEGSNVLNVQQQVNIVDSLSITAGAHQIKMGIDYRRMFPSFQPRSLFQSYVVNSLQTFLNGYVTTATISTGQPADLVYNNIGAYIQDTWKLTPRLTLTYGLRWDCEPAIHLPKAVAVDQVNNVAVMNFRPAGTNLYNTDYKGFAPRIGAAYRLTQSDRWGTVIRSGFGLFYDLMNSETANSLNYPPAIGQTTLPATSQGVPFPPSFAAIAPPPNPAPPYTTFLAVDPKLTLPRVYQWNVALEQSLGSSQTISATYIGTKGDRLLTNYQSQILYENPAVRLATVLSNGGFSNYQGLQVQYKLRMSHGLQLLSSYSWSHAIDDDSDAYNPILGPTPIQGFRASSNFDIRHSFSAGGSYDIPGPRSNPFFKALLGGWSLEGLDRFRSSPPVNIQQTATVQSTSGPYSVTIAPDVVPGQPFYLSNPNAPYGRTYNPAAFKVLGPFSSLSALRQGTAGRNLLRAFPLAQTDMTLRRQFNLHERMNLQFRADFFNLLNHPNFGAPIADPTSSQFGVATGLLGTTLTPNASTAGFNPLYAVGSPRSIQLSLKLNF